MTRVATGFQIAAFTVICLAMSPVILLNFGIFAVQDWIVTRWPNSERARAVRFWLGLLAPIVLSLVLILAIGFAIAHVRALKKA